MMQSKSAGLSVSFAWNPLRSPPTKSYPRSRSKHASCLLHQFVYVVGGKDGNVALKDIWRINIVTSQWEKLNYRGDKLPYLEGHTLVAHKRLLLLFGGGFGDDVEDSSLWIINPDLQHIRKHWNETGVPQPCNRRYHSSVIYNSVMYIYGGYVDLKGSSPDIWAYHMDDEEWEKVVPSQKSEYTAGPRHGHSAVLYGRDMWVFGGSSDLHPKSDLWKFNFHSRTWSKCKLRFGPPAKTGHSACVVKDCMIVFGGENENGLLNSDIWIFSFCSLKWSIVQVSSLSPSPRLWPTLIPVTAVITKGDNTVRTTSMPYLQKKGATLKLQRPKSSPAYSSSRNRVRPECLKQKETRPDSLDIKSDNVNQTDDQSFPILSKTLTHPKEETSPLLYQRSQSNSSVISSGSQKGVDNPGYEVSKSLEKIPSDKRNSNDLSDLKFENSSCQFVKQLNRDDIVLLEKQKPKSRIYLRKGERSKSSEHNNGKKKSPEQVLPGQVFQTKSFKKYAVSETYIPLDDLIEKKHRDSSEYIVEDIENYEDFCCKDLTPLCPKGAMMMLSSQNSNNDHNMPKNTVEMQIIKTPSSNSKHMKKILSSNGKSQSTNDLFEASLKFQTSVDKKKSLSLIDMDYGSNIHTLCWEDKNGKNGSLPQFSNNNNNNVSETDGTSLVCQNLPNSGADVIKTINSQSRQSNTNEIYEIITPYILLLGGKETKGSNINVEPISVWKCDVLLRHSDISHGEYHKSSLVI